MYNRRRIRDLDFKRGEIVLEPFATQALAQETIRDIRLLIQNEYRVPDTESIFLLLVFLPGSNGGCAMSDWDQLKVRAKPAKYSFSPRDFTREAGGQP